MLLMAADTPTGSIDLCDFASAGFHGSSYRSWLRTELGPPIPFSREHPWRSASLQAER